MNIHLLHMNDVHSSIENHMRLATILRSLREQLRAEGDCILTFDIGDALDRVRPETEASMGLINAALLATLNLDGWVFGNNEGLTIPVSQWEQLVHVANTYTFGSNLRQTDGSPFPYFVDSKIFDLQGIRIGVFGLTAPYALPYTMLGVQAMDPISTAHVLTKQLRNAGCHLVICLSHLGLWDDRPLANQVEGIDVILGGHSHQFMMEPEVIGRTVIFQAGKHALAFGQTTIQVNEQTKTVENIECRLISVESEYPLDAQMLTAYELSLPAIQSQLTKQITILEKALPVQFDQESVFSNLLVDILYQTYPVDAGIMMAGALNASLLPGRVEMQHILGACSTPTRPILLSLTGQQILNIIEQSVQSSSFCRPGFGYGFRGGVVGYLSLANMEVILKVNESYAGQEETMTDVFVGSEKQNPLDSTSLRKYILVSAKIGKEQINPKRLYRIVTCEYLWLSSVFPEFHSGIDVEFKEPLIRELLIKHLNNPLFIQTASQFRYHWQTV